MDKEQEIVGKDSVVGIEGKGAIEGTDVPSSNESAPRFPNKGINPSFWIPTLYLTEGLPYTIITSTLVAIFYKDLGFSNEEITLYTGWLYLPWVIKPFWSPFVDMIKTKRWWILVMQLLMGAGFVGIGATLSQGVDHVFAYTLIIFWLIAFSSATHDVAADGFYILSLNSHEQSLFVGIRNTFYRISVIIGQGALLFLADYMGKQSGNVTTGWIYTFYIAGFMVIALYLYHTVMLPKPESDKVSPSRNQLKTFFRTFYKFLSKKHLLQALAFIMLFRLGEAQLGKITGFFMIDPIEKGGLGLTKEAISIIYGTFGVISLTLGGLLGGFMVAKYGLKKCFLTMTLFMNVPNLVYVFMAQFQVTNTIVITPLVCIEQFGYGYGYTAFALYLIYFSRGQYKTTFYALCTGLMALGMMVPGMFAGVIQKYLGYTNFFIWVCICTIPGFIIAHYLKFDNNFGKE